MINFIKVETDRNPVIINLDQVRIITKGTYGGCVFNFINGQCSVDSTETVDAMTKKLIKEIV